MNDVEMRWDRLCSCSDDDDDDDDGDGEMYVCSLCVSLSIAWL